MMCNKVLQCHHWIIVRSFKKYGQVKVTGMVTTAKDRFTRYNASKMADRIENCEVPVQTATIHLGIKSLLKLKVLLRLKNKSHMVHTC